jgi:hypothetical protein
MNYSFCAQPQEFRIVKYCMREGCRLPKKIHGEAFVQDLT